MNARSLTRLSLLAFCAAALTLSGCSRNPYSSRAQNNLNYYRAIGISLAQVNGARRGGPVRQQQAIAQAIDELDRLPTDGIDTELVQLKNSTVNLYQSVDSYLQQFPGGVPVLDPTDNPGYLHNDESTLVEEGIYTRTVLIDRYKMPFPRIFSRVEEYKQQPAIVQSPPPVSGEVPALGSLRDPRVLR